MLLQLVFETPACVSAGTNLGDRVEVVFHDQRLFVDDSGHLIPPKYTVSRHIGR